MDDLSTQARMDLLDLMEAQRRAAAVRVRLACSPPLAPLEALPELVESGLVERAGGWVGLTDLGWHVAEMLELEDA